jgi:phospholipid/cholesterol/gamma-HCH transport system permease protein
MVSAIGSQVIVWFSHPFQLLHFTYQFLARLFAQVFHRRFRFREIVHQVYAAGVQSAAVIFFSIGVVSLILVLEFSFHMKLVIRQDSLVPAFSTVLLIRELGPVVTALLLVSRVGAGLAAEIATMKITDQIDALRLLSIDPFDYLVVPRWLACWISTVLLAVLALGVAIIGGATIAALKLGYGFGEYFNTMFSFANFSDFWGCIVKASVFGNLMPLVACYHGFQCKPGSQGVGMAATSAVVEGSIVVIFADFIVTYLFYAV